MVRESVSRVGLSVSDDPPEDFVLPIEDFIDLHPFQPQDIRSVVESYLEEATRLGYTEVRLIHGRGIGVQRDAVRAVLTRNPLVCDFQDAPAERGGWGATVARLAPRQDDD
jgi:dsDNA-specific endonuclease/ATPase MutS2